MPYSIDRYNGTTLTVVEDGTIDTTLDIKLIGKNYAGYGEVQNENLVHMLENFSGTSAPPRPVSGQLWYDSSVSRLKFYNGTRWKVTAGAEVATSQPTGLATGDFWYDATNDQLYIYNGTEFVLVGPEAAPGLGITQLRSRTVIDTLNSNHAIIECLVDDETVYVISSDEFTLNNSLNAITGFSVIKKGLTLVNTGSTGVTTSDHKYWGTASNSLKLNGRADTEYALVVDLGDFDDTGFTVGNGNDLEVYIDVDGTTPIFKNAQSSTIKFQTTSGTVRTPLTLVGPDILPGTTATSNIGSSGLKYATVYANSFDGVASQATTLFWNSGYRSTAATATANTIAVRDANGDITANQFVGNASTATAAVTATTSTQSNALYETNDGIYRAASRTNTANTVAVRNSAGDIFASTFQGTATQAMLLDVAGTQRSAVTTATANTVAARDAAGALYASAFYGNATSATTAVTATTATNAERVDVDSDSGSTTTYVTFVSATDGYLDLKVNPSMTYNAATNTLNVNVTGAGASSLASTVSITNDNASTTAYLAFVLGTSGGQGVRVDSDLLYNASTNTITGNVTGNVTGTTVQCTTLTTGASGTAGTITGNWSLSAGSNLRATYADLAEKYLADNDYETGTVLMVGGEKEVTATTWGARAIGVVSANPAFIMNTELENGTLVALKGRVPVKVVGSVNKGDRLIAANEGCAVAAVPHANDVFAIALESSSETGIKVIEAVIL